MIRSVKPKVVAYEGKRNSRLGVTSVIICTVAANRLRKVEAGLRSLEEQTFKKFNVIVVDGRGDNLLDKVCKRASKKLTLSRIKIYQNNLAYSRNVGISYAKTQIVSFMDDDAVADKNWLKNIVEVFRRNQSVVGIAGKILSATNFPLSKFSEKLFDYGDLARDVNTITGANMSLHIDRLRKLKGYKRKKIFNENFPFAGEETDACFYIRLHNGRLLFSPEIIVKHCFPSNIIVFVKKHILYGEGDCLVMTRPEYKKFSLIDDYLSAFDTNNKSFSVFRVVLRRTINFAGLNGIVLAFPFLVKEASYAYGVNRSFLKHVEGLK